MAGIRLQPEDADASQAVRQVAAVDLVSDDDRSVAADSWSIKSDYGSTLDDEQRHADAAEALSAVPYRAASDYSSDKEEPDAEAASSMLGFQSYWDAAYADELTNFREHGLAGEIWFGADVMETVATWTKNLCLDISHRHLPNHASNSNCLAGRQHEELSDWSVLDVGTGNGLLLQELSKQGFTDLTGSDYSEAAIDLARNVAVREGLSNIKFVGINVFLHRMKCQIDGKGGLYDMPYVKVLIYQYLEVVDVVLDTKLDRKFQLVTDKGTLDAIGLHPDGPCQKVITLCNSTKDELIQEVEAFNRRSGASLEPENTVGLDRSRDPPFQYIDHIRSYPTFMFGGSVGSRVATVAFLRN